MRAELQTIRQRHRVRFARHAALAAMLLNGAACDRILEVEDPDVVKPDQLRNADAIPTRVAGAVLDFAIAFNGSFNNGIVPMQGLFSDEYDHAETFPDRRELDVRAIDRSNNQASLYTYSSLHVARTSAADAASLIEEFSPDDENLPMMYAFQGYTEIFLGETYCSGVPDSHLDGNTIVFGEPRTTQQVFEDAIADFDEALTIDAESNVARVGRARALLNLGRFAEAAAAVAGVPTDFTELVRHSSTTPAQNNGLWTLATNGRMSVADREGQNGLPFRGANDPRVPWLDTGTLGFDEQTPLYLELTSPNIDSDIVFASGIEARLIEAEAALQTGDRATFFNRHNAARATANLPPLADTGQSPDALADLHFSERAFWFYSTGHRMGDLRRLVRQYGRDPATVLPTGAYPRGGSYGTDLNFPLPIEEDNNPNIAPLQQGCLDRGA